MSYPLKFLQRIGLVSMLLIVGVLVGLMAPLRSEAGSPTLRLDGATINVSTSPTSCTIRSGYNRCHDLTFTSPLTVVGTNNKDRKSTRLNSSHIQKSRMPSSA